LGVGIFLSQEGRSPEIYVIKVVGGEREAKGGGGVAKRCIIWGECAECRQEKKKRNQDRGGMGEGKKHPLLGTRTWVRSKTKKVTKPTWVEVHGLANLLDWSGGK